MTKVISERLFLSWLLFCVVKLTLFARSQREESGFVLIFISHSASRARIWLVVCNIWGVQLAHHNSKRIVFLRFCARLCYLINHKWIYRSWNSRFTVSFHLLSTRLSVTRERKLETSSSTRSMQRNEFQFAYCIRRSIYLVLLSNGSDLAFS